MSSFLKRAVDFILALLMVILLSPLFLLLYFLCRWKLGKPVFFRQKRPGKDAKVFTMYKFRSMTDEKTADGILLADENRLTDFGLFLRKTSLDELPEIFNILKGDMSFVGPRPLLVQYLPRYSKEQARRHVVKPGLTGWAQVNGRNAISWEEKFQLDVWYVDHWSLFLDLKILWKTFSVVWKRHGISAEGEATIGEFMGSSEENI